MRNQSNTVGQRGPKLTVVLTLSLFLCSLTQAAALDLEAQMSPEEYRAAGLDQLTDAQRAALSEWIAKQRIPAAAVSSSADIETRPTEVVPPPAASDNPKRIAGFGGEQVEKRAAAVAEVVEAQIAGDFRGWDGKTLFRLTNGQTWQQRVGGRYRYRAVEPKVNIHRARFGYYLEIVATGRKVGVKRVK